MSTQVLHKPDEFRFEIWLDGKRVGLMDYRISGAEVHLTHTEVDPSQRGKSLASVLLRESLEKIREQKMGMVVPVCSYTVKYMELHPETHDLLANPIEDAAPFCEIPKQ